MRIYLVEAIEPVDYDSYDGHVVIAATEREARAMCPAGDEVEDTYSAANRERRNSPAPAWGFWMDAARSRCVDVGTADDGAAPAVLLSSFRAG